MKSLAETYDHRGINEEFLKQLVQNDKMAELGRISAGVVHELNAPLSVISSAAQMILRETEIPEFVREMVSRIGTEAQRLSHLAKGLLSFSGQESSTVDADINLTTRFVLDFIRYEAARRAVTIEEKLDFRLPFLLLDGNKLKQVLINIIMNALQAMEPDAGILRVETEARGTGEVSISISDTGPGIDPAALEQIFQPYYTTKTSGGGTGLGLFVSKTLIEAMGGRIDVRSTVGEGTTFTVILSTEEQGE